MVCMYGCVFSGDIGVVESVLVVSVDMACRFVLEREKKFSVSFFWRSNGIFFFDDDDDAAAGGRKNQSTMHANRHNEHRFNNTDITTENISIHTHHKTEYSSKNDTLKFSRKNQSTMSTDTIRRRERNNIF